MRIFINRDFNSSQAKILIFRNGQEIAVCKRNDLFCIFPANGQDELTIKYKFPDHSSITIASYVCREGQETILIKPSLLARRWDAISFRYLPYICIFALALNPAFESEWYEWASCGFVVVTALSLILRWFYTMIPALRQGLFEVVEVSNE